MATCWHKLPSKHGQRKYWKLQRHFKVTKEGTATGEICFSVVAVVRGLMDGVDKLTMVAWYFLCCSMMMCGACDESGYSVWENDKRKNRNVCGVVRWQRKSSWRVKSVLRWRWSQQCRLLMETNRPWSRLFLHESAWWKWAWLIFFIACVSHKGGILGPTMLIFWQKNQW